MKLFKFSIILILPLILATFVSTGKAEAAMSSYQELYGKKGCYVRVWTDAPTYYKGATTVDWYAESKGTCGKLDYKATLVPLDGYWSYKYIYQTGYFSNRTPTKSFALNSSTWASSGYGYVSVELSQNGRDIDGVESNNIYIHAQ
ncbi:hypothetical protein JOC75_004025 [Metabacillus crassostreae]|uniref:hypothetical protein n=1 Tax=Metabacillus crassostreae TaxID=929098 RepID=UPI001957278D|nr:hypothetical protein [Metabacillus crassostreae]MBM7605997.1 hypothetical protein [Metabacillus crassostreae]